MNAQTQPSENALTTFGGRLRAVREARGFRLNFTAKEIGISRTSLNQWESDAVKNPDTLKLAAFTKLADVSLDWLVNRTGQDPDLTPRRASRGSAGRSGAQAGLMAAGGLRSAAPSATLDIREIAASLSAHAKELNLAPRGVWAIPEEVLELTFHATPGRTIIMRVASRAGTEFGLARDDFALVDTSRDHIDEPGVYLLADPQGMSARRAVVTEEHGNLRIVMLADDLTRSQVEINEDPAQVLGRVMGVFRPL